MGSEYFSQKRSDERFAQFHAYMAIASFHDKLKLGSQIGLVYGKAFFEVLNEFGSRFVKWGKCEGVTRMHHRTSVSQRIQTPVDERL